MANNYTFNQISTILNNIVADAQGKTANIATTPRSTADFVTMAQVALSAGTDPIMHSITQLISRTIFAYRPYSRKFKTLDTSDVMYGNTIRKITPIFETGAENQPMYDSQPVDGQSTDHYTVKRPVSVQTVFTGAEQWEVKAPTVFVDQLKTAFRGPEELSEFMAVQMGEVSNEIEQQAEQLARMTVANMIGAKVQADSGNVIHLLTEYNAATGLNLSATDVMQPSNYPAFIKWAYARINNISDLMEERSVKYHVNLAQNNILRHTPKEYQRLLIYSLAAQQIKTMALSGIYNKDLLTMPNVSESVNFFQNINAPDAINITAKYMDATGAVQTATVAQDAIFAVLYDRDAMGVNLFNQGAAVTPLNARGMYYNSYYHFAKRYWNDLTENCVVFLLN